MSRSARRAGWIVLAVVLVAALVIGARPRHQPTQAERVRSFTETLKCPTCRSQSIANSDAPLAVTIRKDIERRFAQGQSEDQIRAYLVARYEDQILLTPPASGVDSLVWVLPVVALVVAFGGLALALRRWKRQSPLDTLSDADRAMVDEALDHLHHPDGPGAPAASGTAEGPSTATPDTPEHDERSAGAVAAGTQVPKDGAAGG